MDTGRMSQGQRIAAVAAVLLFIFMFLPFVGVGGVSDNIWESFSTLDIYLLITIAVAIAAALTAGGRGLGLPGLSLNGATALLGAVGTVLLLWLLIFDWFDVGDRKIGAFLSLIAVAAIAYGGWSAAQGD